jgi:hypothetical protein
LAGALLNRLPLFEKATIDDILKIRRELSGPLVSFRAAILRFSQEISEAPWDNDFTIEVDTVFMREVAPAIQELEHAVRHNKAIQPFARKLLGDFTNSSLVGFIASQFVLPEVVAGAVGLTAGASRAIYEASMDKKEKAREIKSNHLFFYYRAGEMLRSHAKNAS